MGKTRDSDKTHDSNKNDSEKHPKWESSKNMASAAAFWWGVLLQKSRASHT